MIAVHSAEGCRSVIAMARTSIKQKETYGWCEKPTDYSSPYIDIYGFHEG